MRATLEVEAETIEKIKLLVRVAEEMGIDVKTGTVTDEFDLVSSDALAEDWESPEDSRWDALFENLRKPT
ncbi:MAG: hypothetical protein ACOYXA_06380 [Bacteroidota bacterium]